MDFEWDDDKYETNLAKHGISFEQAARIFSSPILQREDTRRAYGETRFISTGMVQGVCYVVVHTERNGLTRLISARIGGRRDHKRYYTYLTGGT